MGSAKSLVHPEPPKEQAVLGRVKFSSEGLNISEHFLSKAFARESPTAPRGSRARLLQVVNVFYFLQAVSLMKT